MRDMRFEGKQVRDLSVTVPGWDTPSMRVLLIVLMLLPPTLSSAQSYGERDTGFNLILERTSGPPPGLLAQLVTTSTYPCEGYTIRSRVFVNHDTASIVILGMAQPTPCFQTSSEATGSAYFGEFRAAHFVLKIAYRGDADFYLISQQANGRILATAIRCTFTRLRIRS